MSKKVEEASLEELEAALSEKKKAQKEKQLREREEYVKNRDAMITNLCLHGITLSKTIKDFSALCHDALQKQKVKLDEYGSIRRNSKGGFQIYTEDRLFKIKYAYNAIGDYDERANKAEELLKDFIDHMVKKRDKGAYEIIKSLLERNKAGQLEYSRIQSLYKYENDFDDPRWKEALKLFKESFVIKGSKMQPLLYRLNEHNKYELIDLNFSSM